MRTATIEFSGTLIVYEDGDEWEGEDMSPEDASGWISHAMSRGDKHAWNYTFHGASPGEITYGVEDDD